MTIKHLLITGANRGLGLEFVKQYAADGWHITACCRDPEEATELAAVAAQHDDRVRIKPLDVSDFDQIDHLAATLKGQPIDLLINNAGIYPHSEFGHVHYDDWLLAFRINTMAPYKVTEALLANLLSGGDKKVVTLTSKMGSIEDNTSGGSYIYRSSKAAGNMTMKSLAIDLGRQGIAAAILHPGWVQTDMGGANALITTAQSVSGMRQVIAGLDGSNAGGFYAYDGKQIPW